MQIQRSTLWHGRSGKDKTYFHPRATLIDNKHEKFLMMTLQEITGSDYFHTVEYTISHDNGATWSKPEFIKQLGRINIGNDIQEGVCDIVPDYHPQTDTVLAMGHNVYYKNNSIYDSLGDFRSEKGPRLQRYITYLTYGKSGWSEERKKLEVKTFSECSMFSCGCSQKVVLPDGKLLIPVTFGYFGRKDRMVTSLLCDFDGKTISALKQGNVLENPAKRGLLEPSVTFFKNKYYMTIRAEDNHGYFSTSEDGLNWTAAQAWQFDDGTEMITSTTQQHWMTHDNRLYLVYTRRLDCNANVFRWRTPLLTSEVNTFSMKLAKDSETVVFPLEGDGINKPDDVPISGNFHVTHISESESLITDGTILHRRGYKGDTLLARIKST